MQTVGQCEAWTDRWTVRCHDLRADDLSATQAGSGSLDGLWVHDGRRCTQTALGSGQTRSLGDAGLALFEKTLIRISRFAEARGFRPPFVPSGTYGDSCRATVFFGSRLAPRALDGNGIVLHDLETAGVYDHGDFRSGGGGRTAYGRLFLARENLGYWGQGGVTGADTGLDSATRDAAADAVGADPSVAGAVAHELFHAVQQSYDSFADGAPVWIDEGMPEAFALEWLARGGPGVAVDAVADGRFGRRLDADTYADALDAAPFWRFLADRAGSVGIGWLHDWYETTPGAIGDDPVAGLDAFLAGERGGRTGRLHPDGLYGLWPAFVAARPSVEPFLNDDRIDVDIALGDDPVTMPEGGFLTIRPLAANGHRLSVAVPEGEVAGLEIEVEPQQPDAAEDLHLIVDDRAATDPAFSGVARRNLWRTELRGGGDPQTFVLRVANVARAAEDTTRRAYRLKVAVEPIDPCGMAMMTRALGPGSVRSGDPDMRQMTEPNAGYLAFAGLVDDAGVGCTHFLGTTTEIGRAAARGGDDAMTDALVSQGEALSGRVMEMMESGELDLDALANAEAADVQPGGELSGMVEALQGAVGDYQGEAGATVIQLYSPHLLTWMTGMTQAWPVFTRHAGVGGWGENAIANLLIRLPGTPPDALREGGTYEATVTPEFTPPNAVYARWDGELRPIPAVRASVSTTLPGNHAGPAAAVDYAHAFQGRLETLTDLSLTGTMTVDDITGAAVTGSFALEGSGTLTVEEHEFDYEDMGTGREELVGDTRIDRQESRGPVVARGRFEASTLYPGLERLYFRSATLE